LAGELYSRMFAELYGLETVALRYFNVYGTGQRPDSAYAAVIPLFIEALRNSTSPIVHGDGRQSRDFTYIDDVVAANLAAASAPAERCSGKAYNIAGGQACSLLELLDLLGAILGVEPSPIHAEVRPGDVRHTRADISAAATDLGHRPVVTFEEGLARTVRWFEQRAADAVRPGSCVGKTSRQ
jgi:UDP-glucose 4-epimerase